MKESEILNQLKVRLEEILPGAALEWTAPRGNRGYRPDAIARLRVKGHTLRIILEIVSQPNLARLREKCAYIVPAAHKERGIPAILAPFLNPKMREALKGLGVQYMDLSGNIWLETPSVLLEKETGKNLYPHEAKHRSPFADRASLILRYLLGTSQPAAMHEIVTATGLDSGYVSRIVRAAIDLRYAAIASDGRVRLVNQEGMLGDWTAHYGWGHNAQVGFFHLTRSGVPLAEDFRELLTKHEDQYALTLHAGNNRVAPFADFPVIHLYEEEDSELADRIQARYNLRRVPVAGANLIVGTPYYSDSVFFGARVINGLRVVSDVQLYLDLRRFPTRGLEAAEHILDQRMRPLWSSHS